MKNDFMTFSDYEDELIKLDQRTKDDFAIVLKKDLILKSHTLFEHKSKIKAKPITNLYKIFTLPNEEEHFTYLTAITDLEDTDNNIEFTLYNILNTEKILAKDTVIGHLMVAKSLLKENELAYYANQYILVRELQPNIIKNFTYVIDPDDKHSLVLKLNKRFFENPYAIDIPLEGIDNGSN